MRREARSFRVWGRFEAALGELPGVMRMAVGLEPGLARVEVDGDRVAPEAIAGAITGLGYQVETRPGREAALDGEQALRQAELGRPARWMAVAWPLALVVTPGTFREYWILPRVIPEWLGRPLTLFLLATPAVLGPGWQFFVQSVRGLRVGVTDMNPLDETGTIWVFPLALIVSLPLMSGWLKRRSAERCHSGRRRWRNRSAMELTAAVWVCTLPFIFLLLGPWLEVKAMLAVALAWAVVMALACWMICTTRGAWSRNRGGTQ